MDVLALVEEFQRAADVDADAHRHADREAAEAGQRAVRRRAVDELQDQVVLARIGVVTGRVALHDMGVFEDAAQARLAVEPADELRLSGEVVGEDLHRHRAAGGHVVTLVHRAHPALADLPQKAEAGDAARGGPFGVAVAFRHRSTSLMSVRGGNRCSRGQRVRITGSS